MSNTVHALILDSNEADYAAFVECLGNAGHVSVVVTSAQQARLALQARPFDVLLLEDVLTDGDGLVLCNEIRAQYGDEMVIIFVSRCGTPGRRTVAIQLGADDFLQKPCADEELTARIEARWRRRGLSAVREAAYELR